MQTNSPESKIDNLQNFKLLKIKEGKYHVKFPNLNIPIEMNEAFYKQLLEETSKN